MQCRDLGPESAQERLEWFTHDILPNGQQICAIRPEATKDVAQRIALSRDYSWFLQLLLSEIAQDRAIPFAETHQAILRAMYSAQVLSQPTR